MKFIVSLKKIVIKYFLMKFLSIQIGLAMLVTLFQLNAAILTIPNEKSDVQEFSKKTKRGILGFGAHGYNHGHHQHQHHPEHFDDWQAQHNHPPPPPAPHQPALGSHFHTTITKKVGIPVPYPVPVKVSNIFALNY